MSTGPGPGAAVLARFADLVASGATRAERDAALEELQTGLAALKAAATEEPA